MELPIIFKYGSLCHSDSFKLYAKSTQGKLNFVTFQETTPKRKIKYGDGKDRDENVKTRRILQIYCSGQLVYFKDCKGVWIPATIQRVDGDKLTVILSSKEIVKCTVEDVLLRSETNVGEIETLTSLTPLNEATVLCCLNSRYYNKIFYTSAGSTIIALNPFTDVQHLYTDHTIHCYHNNNKTQKLPPHIYEIAETAYCNLIRELGQINQSIVVSGESGAGKTVSAKHLLRYLTQVSNHKTFNSGEKESRNKGDIIQNKILDSNPLLEAFGNAATPRNTNSSRFGKYIQLEYNRCGGILGGAIQTYLLEKTRIVHQGESEFNFHIFYQMMNETEDVPSWLSSLQDDLKNTEFKILPQSNAGLMEHQKLTETLHAMKDIGISIHQQNAVFQLLSSILYLGNINFSALDEDESSMSVNLVSTSAMDKASVQLGLSSDQVEKVFLHRNIQSSSRRSVFIKPVSIVEAKNRRDCLSMLLYSRLFEWLVNFINSAIVAEEYNSTIGLLDIYGFEKFDNNSLEQLCINYANEKIQQHYVAHFMKDLQKEYEVERIEWNSINYNDNQHCLNVLEGKHSIFGVLNEEVFLSRKSNKRVLGDRLLEIGSHGDKPVIKKPKKFSAEPGFIVRHYADDVKYTVDQLVTKNKDNISLELIRLLKSSEDSFIQELFSSYQTIDSPGKKKRTVLAKFKKSLDELMLSLNQSEVHYIRCIKPNMKSHPGLFDRPYVTQQLRANGILETVEICKQGYPARIIYWEFLQRYGMLIPEGLCLKDHTNTGSSSSDNDNAFVDPLDALLRRQLELPDAPKRTPTPKKILRRRTGLSPGDHARRCCSVVLKIVFGADQMMKFIKQFGKSKLFLLQSQLEMLESSRALVIRKHIIVLQWAIRRFLIKARFHRKFAVKKIWRCWIKYRRRRREKIRNIAASIIQRAHRNWRLRNPKVKYPKQYALQMINGEEKHISNGDLLDNKFNLHQDSLSTRDNTSDFKDTNMENMISSKVPVPEEFTPTSKNYSKYDKIPGSIVFPDSNCGISPNKGKHHFKRIMETSVSEDETENDQPPLKKLKVACKSYRNLKHIKISDGILTKRRLPQVDLRFHTRPSVLKNAHIAPMKEIQCSLTDCLKHSHLIDD